MVRGFLAGQVVHQLTDLSLHFQFPQERALLLKIENKKDDENLLKLMVNKEDGKINCLSMEIVIIVKIMHS